MSITIHNSQDFNSMRKAGRLAASVLDYITEFVQPGITTEYLNDLCHKYIIEHNTKLSTINPKIGMINGKGFIYARTSNNNDISIDTQRETCFKYAHDNNIKLADFGFQYDQVSARNMNNLNHELGFWIDYVEDNADIIIYSIDRLSRNLEKGVKFLKSIVLRGIKVHFILENIVYSKDINAAHLDMIYNGLRNAEHVSNTTSEKVINSIRKRKAEGHVFGKAPYGFRNVMVDGIRKRIKDNKSQEIIRIVTKRYYEVVSNINQFKETDGVQNNQTSICKYILKWLRQQNIKFNDDIHFTLQQIKRIILNHD